MSDPILKIIKKGITSSTELRQLADAIGLKLNGIYDISELKNKKLPNKGSFIILLRKDSGVGHWCAIHNLDYFDSYGILNPPELKGIKNCNETQLQGSTADFCGQYCILWIYSKQKNRPDLMNNFIDLDVKLST